MAFNRNNQADLTALKTEVETDPAARGYAAAVDITALVTLLNATDTGSTINRDIENIGVADIAAIIDGGEYAALDEYNKEWVKSFINQDNSTPIRLYKDKFLSVFGAGTTTRTAAQALLSVDASRAEVLFGAGTVLSRRDWIDARSKG